jgi:hypothetical protein
MFCIEAVRTRTGARLRFDILSVSARNAGGAALLNLEA